MPPRSPGSRRYLLIIGLFVLAAVIGSWLGRHIIDRLSDNHYERIIRWSITVLAARMLLAALWDLGGGY